MVRMFSDVSRKYEQTKTVAKAEEAMARVTRTLENMMQVKRECSKERVWLLKSKKLVAGRG
jgi:hypothetical protein